MDAVWTPDEEMEPPMPPPGPTGQNAPAAMETTPPEEDPDSMCAVKMTAIPIRVGAKLPTNLDKAGAPMELYAPASITIPPLGASRVHLGLHVQLPAGTEIVLQIRINQELTMLITNDSHTEQRISRGACLAQAILDFWVRAPESFGGRIVVYEQPID